ncbi:MAG: RNA pseudouridine synthase [Candidatus Magasanikbacteria bacterium]|nr:RNA pseudouridine synthase [Candidatus Magasanikbacteria bacterium]
MSLQILYEDNHLIAVYKPVGVLVQGDDTGDSTLMDEVKYYLKTKYHKLGKVFLGLIHRLDRPVQGIILFAKTSKGASRLSEQFRNHSVEKIYHALVIGKPEKQRDTLVHYLQKEEKNNKVTVSPHPHPLPPGEGGYGSFAPREKAGMRGWQRAELSYEVVKSNDKFSLLKIQLGTGRSHQIRAQLSAIGCPIVGDVKYGADEPLPDKSLALAATSLTFMTATGDEEKVVTIEIPEAWDTFLV